MFKFKKQADSQKNLEEFECECCGALDTNTGKTTGGCSASCGTANTNTASACSCSPAESSDSKKS